MSNDLHDLFKKELDRLPLRPADTWMPDARSPRVRPSGWRMPLAIAIAALVLLAGLVGGRQLATLRSAAAPAVVGGKAIYLSPSFNGSGWIQIDPETLRDVSSKALLDIGPSSTNSSATIVSADGSTIIVADYGSSGVTQRVFDARTGQLRGYFVPDVAMVVDALSADGQQALGRLGDNRSSLTGEKVIVSIADGHVLRRVPAVDIGPYQAWPVAPDLSAIYFLTTPTEVSLVSPTAQNVPYSLVVQSTVTGAMTGPVPLPGIAAGTVLSGPTSAPTPLSFRPGIAISADGGRLAALSMDGRTLDIVDTRTLGVTAATVHKKTSIVDLLRPAVAAAKTLNDEERRSLAFTPDGASVITFTTSTRYDETGATRVTRGLQRVEVATGVIAAETTLEAGIYDLAFSPDGRGVYLIVRAKEPPTPAYVLRRLDAQTLELTAERTLPDYEELHVLVAPSPALAAATPTPPTRTQPAVGCTHDRLVSLAGQFFSRYNARRSADLLQLFNHQAPAAAGGFSDYNDNPGVAVHITDAERLLPYWENRFGSGDRFDSHTASYPPEGATGVTANPTATFTRSFSGGTQQGNMQLDCNAGLLVAVRMNSDYAGWGSRDAFGVRFSVPSSWKGPEDIDTQKGAGAPKNWLVFTDASGDTQITVWLFADISAETFVTTRLTSQGSERKNVTIVDAGQTRNVIEVHAPASWSGPTGSGSYDNRHLVVQLTPSLVADVIVNAPRINGASTVAVEQVLTQDRITVRIAATN